MFDPSNFIINLNSDYLKDTVSGFKNSLNFTLENTDTAVLYNISFSLTLGDGLEFVDASVPYTNRDTNIYNFINIKDLAPKETTFEFTIDLKANTTFSDGSTIPFGTIIPCTLKAYGDTMPRGNFDTNNQVIAVESFFSFNLSKYIIYKTNPSQLLLGQTYISKIIIQTAENSSVFFSKIQDTLGNGVNFLSNVSVDGYTSQELTNYDLIEPNNTVNSFKVLWNNVLIPANTTVTISYSVKFNERYYLNGTAIGNYIENGSSSTNNLSWIVDDTSYFYDYAFIAYELILKIMLSKYTVDINEALTYYIYFYANLYHDLLNLSGYLTTTDGQVLSDKSIPMYSSKDVSLGGITQITWNVGSIFAGQTTIVSVDGNIASQYISSSLDILSGDKFSISTNCNAISAATNKIISYSDSSNLSITLPSASKTITGYYYRDNTPKLYNIAAPGDLISYKSVYDSSNLNAPSSQIKLFDFYPYIINNVDNIIYQYPSSQLPGTTPIPVNPHGQLWYINKIAGKQYFEMNYTAPIDYVNGNTNFQYNLFKLQSVNSDGISASSRSQVGFNLGKPKLILNKTVSGKDINKIKIGEIYNFSVTLINYNSNNNVTDAFDIIFTESLPYKITLDSNSVVAKINTSLINTTIQDNLIIINIPKLAPNDIFTLKYNVSINDTLGPNERFIFTSSTTAPYTQVYDANNPNNLQYDVGAYSKNSVLNSENILLQVTSDLPSKIVGDVVYYNLKITIPKGQRLLSFYGLILIPPLQVYLNEAWLNGTPITINPLNNTMIFSTIYNIDTTTNSLVYNYSIKCVINDSIVSTINPQLTIENLYGNLNYISIQNATENLGINNTITIYHPHVDLSIESSSIMSNFEEMYLVGSNNSIYTKVTASNSGNTQSNNVQITINIPNNLNFDSIENYSEGVISSYNNQTNILSVNIDTIAAISNKYLIFKSNLFPNNKAESKLIIIGDVNKYYNNISSTKIYTSDSIFNNELYLNSVLSFFPLRIYSLVGSTAAINLSKLGESTEIEFIITNLGQGSDSYKLEMTPIDYEYDLYINENFIKTVTYRSTETITSPLLNNLHNGEKIYVTFKYTIPIDTAPPCYQTMIVKLTSLNNSNTKKIIPTTLQDP